jgi:hypothetical protein
MATTTTLNGTITASTTQVTLTAFTNPSTGQVSVPTLLVFPTGEKMRVTDATLSPTLSVVRGYEGTSAIAHTTGEGVQYGLMGDSSFTEANTYVGQHQVDVPSTIRVQTQIVTATGTTGSNAATVIAGPMAVIAATGAGNAGVNLWVPSVGDTVFLHNDSTTGSIIFYSVGATLAAVTGVTGVTITQTGTKGAMLACLSSAVWTVVIGAT